MPTDFSRYSSIVFIDSMVALHCPPLPHLPWREIDATGPILVLIVPQVAHEIDKRKRDERLSAKARSFGKLLGPAAIADEPARIAEGPPPIDLALAHPSRIDWVSFDDLDRDEGDERVIAQILHTRDLPRDRSLLLSHDVYPLGVAARHGLRRMALPDSWLSPPESHPKDKEIQRLKGVILKLSSTQPKLEAQLDYKTPTPLRLFKVTPLTAGEKKELLKSLALANPPARQERPFGYADPMQYDADYGDRYGDYVTHALPRFLDQLGPSLELHYAQIGFRLVVQNVGSIQAERLLVALRTSGGLLRERFALSQILPPLAPRRQTMIDRLGHINAHFDPSDFVRGQPGPHDVRLEGARSYDGQLEAHCEDFRHGRSWSFEGVATIATGAPSPFSISVEMTAANLRDTITSERDISFEIETVRPEDLVDLVDRRRLVAIPLQERFDAAMNDEDDKWIESVVDEDD